jgi:hypothetical protein
MPPCGCGPLAKPLFSFLSTPYMIFDSLHWQVPSDDRNGAPTDRGWGDRHNLHRQVPRRHW